MNRYRFEPKKPLFLIIAWVYTVDFSNQYYHYCKKVEQTIAAHDTNNAMYKFCRQYQFNGVQKVSAIPV